MRAFRVFSASLPLSPLLFSFFLAGSGLNLSTNGGGGSTTGGFSTGSALGVGGAPSSMVGVTTGLDGSSQYTTTSLMATGNTHHIFDSTPPIQDDPFAQSSNALTALIDNSGNATHPVAGRGERQQQQHKQASSSSNSMLLHMAAEELKCWLLRR